LNDKQDLPQSFMPAMRPYKHDKKTPDEVVRREHRLHWTSHTPTDVNLQSAPSDMLSGLMLEDAVLYNATRKVANPPDKQLFLAVLAGVWVGLGGLTAVSIAGGVPEDVRARWPSLPKFLNGAFFAFGPRTLPC
jgi:hypothetical protein